MNLFNQFRETIFLKTTSALENDINELKNIRSNMKNNSNIDKDIKLLEYGLNGEKEIEYELKNANIGMFVIHDLNIVFEDLTSQIDYVIVTKAYTYLVECKNMIGNITINEHGEFKREYTYNNEKIVEGIYSPFRQALRHKEILKKIWLNKNNKLNILLYEKKFDRVYKPIVVLTNSKGLLNKRYAPKNIKDVTIRSDELIEYIKKDIDNYDKDYYLSKKNMEDFANGLLKLNVNKESYLVEKYQKSVNNDDKLIEKLKEYRKTKAYTKNIPAYYIFNDKELENLIKFKPKSLEELKKLKILEEIKIKLHGLEIINIINNIDL